MEYRVLGPSSPELGEVKRLYERAFPPNERWGFGEILSGSSGAGELLGFYEGGAFAGFAALLNLGDITHIIYLAIAEERRCRGMGGEALGIIAALKPGRRIVLDIERERGGAGNNAQRRRRKAFYMRNGYVEAGVGYDWRGESYEILIRGGEISPGEYLRFWKGIKG